MRSKNKKLKRAIVVCCILFIPCIGIGYTIYNKPPTTKYIVIVTDEPALGLDATTLRHTANKYNVYYIAPKNFRGAPANLLRSNGYVFVDNLYDFSQLKAAMSTLIAKHNIPHIDRLVQLNKKSKTKKRLLALAAKLRETCSIKGLNPSQAVGYMDRRSMKDKLTALGAPTIPHTSDLTNAFRQLSTDKVVIKSDTARLLHIIDDEQSLQKVIDNIKHKHPSSSCMAEPYIGGTVFHVDGILQDGRILLTLHHQLLGTDYDFYIENQPKGYITVTEPAIKQKLNELAHYCSKLVQQDGPFHLEAIQDKETKKWFILKVKHGITTAQWPQALHKATGFDFRQNALKAIIGEKITIPHAQITSHSVAVVTMPPPCKNLQGFFYSTGIKTISPNTFGLPYESLLDYHVVDDIGMLYSGIPPKGIPIDSTSDRFNISFLLANKSSKKLWEDLYTISKSFELTVYRAEGFEHKNKMLNTIIENNPALLKTQHKR